MALVAQQAVNRYGRNLLTEGSAFTFRTADENVRRQVFLRLGGQVYDLYRLCTGVVLLVGDDDCRAACRLLTAGVVVLAHIPNVATLDFHILTPPLLPDASARKHQW